MTISTPAWLGVCPSATATCLSLAASTVTRALRPGWWLSTRPPQRHSSCRRSAGGCGFTSEWTQRSLWVTGPCWMSPWPRSSPRSWARMSPSPITPWSSPTPTTPRCWCGGQRMVTLWWSSHQNTDLFHWPDWPWIPYQYHLLFVLFVLVPARHQLSLLQPFSLLFASIFFCLMFFKRLTGGKKSRQRQIKPALRKKRPAVASRGLLEHTFKTGANKLQPFYLQTGSGRTVLKSKRCKNEKLKNFFVFYLNFIFWLFGPSDMRFVSVGFKYLNDHVRAHATYMDMHKPCEWIPVVFIYGLGESAFIFVCCRRVFHMTNRIGWHSRF